MSSTTQRFLRYILNLWPSLLLGLFCLLLVVGASLGIPWIIGDLIDGVLIPGQEEGLFYLNLLTLGTVFLFLLKGIFGYGQVYLMSLVAQKLVLHLRNQLYAHLQQLSLSFYGRRQVGELISRFTNDLEVIQGSISMGFASLIKEPITIMGILILIFYIHWQLALITICIIPFIALIINFFGQKMRKISSTIQARLADVTSILQENISAIRIIKAFGREKEELKKFKQSSYKTFTINMKGVQVTATVTPVVELLAACGAALFLWYGGREVIAGRLTTGSLITFLGYIAMILTPLRLFSQNYNLFQKALGAAERIFSVFDTKEVIPERPDAPPMPPIQGTIEIREVTLSYEREEVLKDISLQVDPGEVIALVGPSGSGKTSLASLIPRFYDPQQGQVLIDGQDVREVNLQSLRRQIGIVTQETILFRGSIAYNIAYGNPDARMDAIQEAAKQANAHDFICNFPEGYQTLVGERGLTLSGGERQRIAIARAILGGPRILILDEATSALDTASESLVQEALHRVMKGRTTVIIAHRLSTIKNAHRIAVIDGGKIVELGTHRQLLREKGLYQKFHLA